MDWRGAAKGGTTVAGIGVRLAERLEEIRQNVDALLPAERMVSVERAIRELKESRLAEHILSVGVQAPAFELPDQAGRAVRSTEFGAGTSLIVIFYRGRWCPYDVTTLETWNQWLPQVEGAGAKLVAISPQKPQHTFFTADQHQLQFPVLSDAGNAVARQFRLVYRLPDYLEQHYRRVFINLPNSNGDQTWELPLAATYVIGRDAKVLHAKAEPDFRFRDEPQQVLGAAV